MPEARSVLIVEDDADVRSLLTDLCSAEGYKARPVRTGQEALDAIGDKRPDLVVMDVQLPDMDGLQVLKQVRQKHPELEVIVMTAFGGSSIAIKAMEQGAYDYITKPFEIDDFQATLRRVFEHQDMASEVSALRQELGKTAAQRERIVGNSRPMQEVYKLIGKVARSEATVLITGESGTGKELVAEALHKSSARNPYPLVKVSCAALPESLLETELFGHEKGSFTGALAMRKGRFEMANKGTIFLDEIGEMTLATQTKLLRILQEREFERIGASTPIKVDIRVIAATNRNLEGDVKTSRFREDLYYRLNVIHIHMPPLRERKDDIPMLVEHFLVKYRHTPGAIPTTISEEALEMLTGYHWPGNVRELENAVERAVVLSRGNLITTQHLPFGNGKVAMDLHGESNGVAAAAAGGASADGGRRAGDNVAVAEQNRSAAATPLLDSADLDAISGEADSFRSAIAAVERRVILKALERASGDHDAAAKSLGLVKRDLASKIKEYGLGA